MCRDRSQGQGQAAAQAPRRSGPRASGRGLTLRPEPDGQTDVVAEAERVALRLLAVRDHSRLELVRKLRARAIADEAVDAALDRLAADGALDEERMMAAYVAERAGKGFGPLRIRAELRERGLPDDRIETHLGSMADDWPARLADAHDRRFGSGRPSDGADYGRRGRFLEQRGFSTDMIRRFLR